MTEAVTSTPEQGRARPVGRIRARRVRRNQARQQWGQAATLPELGEVTARWLEGGVTTHPSYYGRPDPETRHLIPVLAELNRAGYVTEGSQPGLADWGYDGRWWRQRAAVYGYCDGHTLARIQDAAADAGLWVVANWPTTKRRLRSTAVPVTLAGQRVNTSFGARRHPRDVAFSFDWCDDETVDWLQRSWQVTVVDPEWGRNDRLWPVLAGAVR